MLRDTKLPDFYTSLARIHPFIGDGVPVVMYHKISEFPPQLHRPHKGLFLSPKKFQTQIHELRRCGFRGISLDELAPGSRLKSAIALTFDDGFESVFLNALPSLVAAQFVSINYLVADLIGKTNEWDAQYPETPQRLMDKTQVREWIAAGQQIGSHTLTHPFLTKIDPLTAKAEIFDSKKKLEDEFGVPVDHFCYPYGDFNAQIADWAGEAGYRTATTTRRGICQPDTAPLKIPRLMGHYGSRKVKLILKEISAKLRFRFSPPAARN